MGQLVAAVIVDEETGTRPGRQITQQSHLAGAVPVKVAYGQFLRGGGASIPGECDRTSHRRAGGRNRHGATVGEADATGRLHRVGRDRHSAAVGDADAAGVFEVQVASKNSVKQAGGARGSDGIIAVGDKTAGRTPVPLAKVELSRGDQAGGGSGVQGRGRGQTCPKVNRIEIGHLQQGPRLNHDFAIEIDVGAVIGSGPGITVIVRESNATAVGGSESRGGCESRVAHVCQVQGAGPRGEDLAGEGRLDVVHVHRALVRRRDVAGDVEHRHGRAIGIEGRISWALNKNTGGVGESSFPAGNVDGTVIVGREIAMDIEHIKCPKVQHSPLSVGGEGHWTSQRPKVTGGGRHPADGEGFRSIERQRAPGPGSQAGLDIIVDIVTHGQTGEMVRIGAIDHQSRSRS